ncbi:PREDICTED: inositol 1,4,5-trisphosphate receptor-interacting protein-like 1, partial [Eurypyga helias]|uniref:inositol 1,4,5-trisphosphate receptor-interacting protein-like 1 n=1 Tax=Eurypyga helias TaxID=54383 RepID=UPI000528BF2E
TGQLSARHSRVCVVLECTCARESILGNILCFLHHPDDTLPRDQNSTLLHTLCTCSYLDAEKVTSWVQLMVQSAWLLLPQSHHCQLKGPALLQVLQVPADNNPQGEHLHGDDVSSAARQLYRCPEQRVGKGELLMAWHSQQDNLHLRGLQLCAHILVVLFSLFHPCL